MGGGDRDLKMKETAAMEGGDRVLKMKEAAALEGGDRNLKLQSVAIGEGFHELWIGEGGIDLKKKQAAAIGGADRDLEMKEAAAMEGGYRNLKVHSVATEEGFHELSIGEGDRDLKTAGRSEGGDTLKMDEGSRPTKAWQVEGGILKLKNEATAAMNHWFRTRSPTRLDRKEAQEKMAQLALGPGKKKIKKVVKSKFPKELIDHIEACPFTICKDASDEDLAQRTPELRQLYFAIKGFETKNREYWNALIDQQKELGYAEDEIEVEVTDDEEEAVEN